MNATGYSMVFDASRGMLKAKPRVSVLYNGLPIAEHASREDADAAIDRLVKLCGTSRSCFEVKETMP